MLCFYFIKMFLRDYILRFVKNCRLPGDSIYKNQNQDAVIGFSGEDPCPLRAPLVVTFVGLPCRGKSLAAHKIARHLSWRGEFAKVITVNENATAETLQDITSWFQKGNNVVGKHTSKQQKELLVELMFNNRDLANDRKYVRTTCAKQKEMLNRTGLGLESKSIPRLDNLDEKILDIITTHSVDGDGETNEGELLLQIPTEKIIDGMHLTRQSRLFVASYCKEAVYHHLIVEFNCDDKSLEDNLNDTIEFHKNLEQNVDWQQIYMDKLQKNSRLEACSPFDGPLIAVNNSENPFYHSVTARGVQGALQTGILGVLASPVIRHQVFYFSRHGESEYNVLGRIGGDSELSSRGRRYAERLTRQLCAPGYLPGFPRPKLIWTSEYCRTVNTVINIPGPRAAVKDLNEIDAGICEGLTYEEIQERFPQEFAWRDQDKLKYRYPHGESYLDLLQRVDNVVQALLTKTDVLVVSHQAVLRCIMAYFTGSKPEDIPYINVPLHTLLTVKSFGYDFQVETIPLKVECVDTYRNQPENCSSGRTDADALGTVPAHFDTPMPQIIN